MRLLVVLFLSMVSIDACAQYACPPGYYPIGGGQDAGGFHGCTPLEGEGGQAPAPQWEARWGSIAIANGAYGVSGGMRSEVEAEKAAMSQCQAHAETGSCATQMTYYNQCAALAWGDMHYAISRSPERDAAESDAMKNCSASANNCKIFYSDCSYPEQVQ